MPKRKITYNEALEYVKQMPYPDFKEVVFQYASATKIDLENGEKNSTSLEIPIFLFTESVTLYQVYLKQTLLSFLMAVLDENVVFLAF